MIATGDIKDILLDDICKHPVLGTISEITKDVACPVTIDDNCEQVVVMVGEAVNEPLQRTDCEVVIYVPDVREEIRGVYYIAPNHERLTQLENECIDLFTDEAYGVFAGRNYTYKLNKIKQEAEPQTWSHALMVSITFETVNIH